MKGDLDEIQGMQNEIPNMFKEIRDNQVKYFDEFRTFSDENKLMKMRTEKINRNLGKWRTTKEGKI